jgi:hypothetical protein
MFAIMPTAQLSRWMTLCYPFFFFITVSYGPCLSMTHAQVESPTSFETKRILILHSFEGNAPIFQITDKGLSGRLSSGGISS